MPSEASHDDLLLLPDHDVRVLLLLHSADAVHTVPALPTPTLLLSPPGARHRFAFVAASRTHLQHRDVVMCPLECNPLSVWAMARLVSATSRFPPTEGAAWLAWLARFERSRDTRSMQRAEMHAWMLARVPQAARDSSVMSIARWARYAAAEWDGVPVYAADVVLE
jgi:hypothetical protein